MGTYKQNVGAGQSVDFPGGEVFYLVGADYPVTLTFYDSNRKPMDVFTEFKAGLNGLMFRDEQGKTKPFVSVNVASQAAQKVKVHVSSAVGSYQRSQGDVTVTNIEKDDSWYYETKNQRAFVGTTVCNAIAGQVGLHQLLNPAASGAHLIVNRITGYCAVAALARVNLRYYNAPIAGGTFQGNKYLGGAGSVAEMHAEPNAVLLGMNVADISYVDATHMKFDADLTDPIYI